MSDDQEIKSKTSSEDSDSSNQIAPKEDNDDFGGLEKVSIGKLGVFASSSLLD